MIIIIAGEGKKETRISTDFLSKMFRNVLVYLSDFCIKQNKLTFSGKYSPNDLLLANHSESNLLNFSA